MCRSNLIHRSGDNETLQASHQPITIKPKRGTNAGHRPLGIDTHRVNVFLLVCTVAALALVSPQSIADLLSPVEQRMVDSIKARSPAALQLLERAVNINSCTMNHGGVREVGKHFRAQLDEVGFVAKWVDTPAAL